MSETKKKLTLILLVGIVFQASLGAYDDPFARALNIYGATGFCAIPHAGVMQKSRWALGIHNFSPKAAVRVPFLPLEIGMMTSLNQGDDEDEHNNILQVTTISVKLRVLDERKKYINIAGGLDRNEIEKWGFYVASGAKLPVPHLFGRVSIGYGYREGGGRLNGAFGGISITMHPSIQFMVEYDASDYNCGFRLLLSPKIKVDILLISLIELRRQTNVRSFFNEIMNVGLSIDMALENPWKKKKKSN